MDEALVSRKPESVLMKSKLDRILRKCIREKQIYEPSMMVRNMHGVTADGNRFLYYGANSEGFAPAEVAMVCDVSGSMNIGMYELAVLAIVKILNSIGTSIQILHVIPFCEGAAYNQLSFGRSGTNDSRGVYNELLKAVKRLGVGSGAANIIPALNL